ncbi:hypothetical protein [Reichenbachiella versicolor]|uniref:hypothetical protein n=1 Tax=Reichenbachiella versicolor TaxID=1821036 RepID=UPI000D6E9730|nr:hypothetical protein [Reichenbachiella versicolor]
MEQEKLIIQLIQQDLKHNQLTQGLIQIGLDHGGDYDLDILSIVAKLMGVPEENIDNRWIDIYVSFMCEAHKVAVLASGENLIPLAEQCYELLRVEWEIVSRLNLR